MSVIEDVLKSDWFLTALANVAVVSTTCLFLTGFEICWRIKKANSTDSISSAPFHIGFVSGILWLEYGLFKGDTAVIRLNIAAFILYTLYVIYYWSKTSYPAKRTQNQIIAVELVFLAVVFVYIRRPEAGLDNVLILLGHLCVVSNIVTTASPLAAFHDAIKIRSTENLPLPLCVANLLVTVEWMLYGVIVNDIVIKITNGIGLVMCVAQLIPFMIFPRKRRSSAVSSKFFGA